MTIFMGLRSHMRNVCACTGAVHSPGCPCLPKDAAVLDLMCIGYSTVPCILRRRISMVHFHDSLFMPAESSVTLLFVFLPWCRNIPFFPPLCGTVQTVALANQKEQAKKKVSHSGVLPSALCMAFCLLNVSSGGFCCNSLFSKHPLAIRPYLHSNVFQVWN